MYRCGYLFIYVQQGWGIFSSVYRQTQLQAAAITLRAGHIEKAPGALWWPLRVLRPPLQTAGTAGLRVDPEPGSMNPGSRSHPSPEHDSAKPGVTRPHLSSEPSSSKPAARTDPSPEAGSGGGGGSSPSDRFGVLSTEQLRQLLQDEGKLQRIVRLSEQVVGLLCADSCVCVYMCVLLCSYIT